MQRFSYLQRADKGGGAESRCGGARWAGDTEDVPITRGGRGRGRCTIDEFNSKANYL